MNNLRDISIALLVAILLIVIGGGVGYLLRGTPQVVQGQTIEIPSNPDTVIIWKKGKTIHDSIPYPVLVTLHDTIPYDFPNEECEPFISVADTEIAFSNEKGSIKVPIILESVSFPKDLVTKMTMYLDSAQVDFKTSVTEEEYNYWFDIVKILFGLIIGILL